MMEGSQTRFAGQSTLRVRGTVQGGASLPYAGDTRRRVWTLYPPHSLQVVRSAHLLNEQGCDASPLGGMTHGVATSHD